MIIGFLAWPPDNGTYMWASDDEARVNPPKGVICGVCGQRIDYTAVNPKYAPPRSYYDLSRCYDGDVLVSPKLRTYLEECRLQDIKFVNLASCQRYFVLQCERVLKFIPPATAKREEYCAACKQYRSVWGNVPERAQFEGVDRPMQEGLFFTDLKVGYYPQMGPLLIAGVRTWQELLAQKFKGFGNGKPIVN